MFRNLALIPAYGYHDSTRFLLKTNAWQNIMRNPVSCFLIQIHSFRKQEICFNGFELLYCMKILSFFAVILISRFRFKYKFRCILISWSKWKMKTEVNFFVAKMVYFSLVFDYGDTKLRLYIFRGWPQMQSFDHETAKFSCCEIFKD